MTTDVEALVARFASELERLADPVKATQMARYMKTQMPFYGVQQPDRAKLVKATLREFPISDRHSYERVVGALWRQPHREEKYLALAIANRCPTYVNARSLKLYESLIREGGWWDFVDDIAIHLVGKVVRDEPEQLGLIDEWIDDEDLWIRRTALLCQIAHKQHTDERRLFRYCRGRAEEQEFFIRKAIGWALREYSYTQPRAVIGFLNREQSRLSGLSYREAAKGLRRKGYDV